MEGKKRSDSQESRMTTSTVQSMNVLYYFLTHSSILHSLLWF